MKKIVVLIPCHNEEQGIAKVLSNLPYETLGNHGFTVDAIVIDNNSTDNTAKVAEQLGAKVIHERKKGKGNAILTGFKSLPEDTDYVVMLDGDNSYKPEELFRLVEPLHCDFADVIVGSRLGGKLKANSLKTQNRIVNWLFTFLVRQCYMANVTDVLTGYFAWKKHVVDELVPHLTSKGFEIEMEMITKIVRLGFEIYSVPITYDKRDGESKIEAIKDGISIMRMLLKNLLWNPGKAKVTREPKYAYTKGLFDYE